MEGAAHGGLRRQGEHLGCGGVEKDDTPFPVDGQNPLLQGLQNVLPLVEAPGEGVWFVAHQGALDAPGQPQGQQGPHCRRQRTDRLHHRPPHGLIGKEHNNERKRFCFQIPG